MIGESVPANRNLRRPDPQAPIVNLLQPGSYPAVLLCADAPGRNKILRPQIEATHGKAPQWRYPLGPLLALRCGAHRPARIPPTMRPRTTAVAMQPDNPDRGQISLEWAPQEHRIDATDSFSAAP